MRKLLETYRPLLGLGMVSLVLGTIALLLAFMPILGIPISLFGILFGLIGVIGGLARGGLTLRWGLGGTALSCLALAVNLGLIFAPEGYLPTRTVPPIWEPVPGRPYIPPPAQGWRTDRPAVLLAAATPGRGRLTGGASPPAPLRLAVGR
jgi:hypothetical protein